MPSKKSSESREKPLRRRRDVKLHLLSRRLEKRPNARLVREKKLREEESKPVSRSSISLQRRRSSQRPSTPRFPPRSVQTPPLRSKRSLSNRTKKVIPLTETTAESLCRTRC